MNKSFLLHTKNKKQNNKSESIISLISLNVNGLNNLIKAKMIILGKKTQFNFMQFMEDTL